MAGTDGAILSEKMKATIACSPRGNSQIIEGADQTLLIDAVILSSQSKEAYYV